MVKQMRHHIQYPIHRCRGRLHLQTSPTAPPPPFSLLSLHIPSQMHPFPTFQPLLSHSHGPASMLAQDPHTSPLPAPPLHLNCSHTPSAQNTRYSPPSSASSSIHPDRAAQRCAQMISSVVLYLCHIQYPIHRGWGQCCNTNCAHLLQTCRCLDSLRDSSSFCNCEPNDMS